ncbi:MAG: hypothetical protein LBD86_07300, partial [Spirochaetaceae bacterium]|nr:hypothetical protein [Spirochaetaceae bacterium]
MTVFPSITGFSRYQYLFAKDGGEALDSSPNDWGLFELEPGTYTVTVKAFVGDGTTPAAEGSSGAFTVTAGVETPPIKVSLAVAEETGAGTFSFTPSYPEDAELDSFRLTRLGGEEYFDLAESGPDEGTGMDGKIFSGGRGGIGAGYWLAQASLYRDDLHAGKSEVAHIYDGLSTGLNWTFSEDDFSAIPVVSNADSVPGTLREAIASVNAAGGGTIFIDLPADDNVITLTRPLDTVRKGLRVLGNGATLTQTGFTPSATSQLLYINSTSATVKISRLHFKGGRATAQGGAIRNKGNLTLESCIFSDNQTSASTGSGGGAVYTTGGLTVRGCTFYKNKAASGGGAIYRVTSGDVTLTGNLFIGNTASNDENGHVVYGTTANIKSGGYNVSDRAAGNGTTAGNGSGYAANTNGSDNFGNTAIISLANFKPFAGYAAVGALTNLPEGYPALDFYGDPIEGGGASGAVQATTAGGYYLDYGANYGKLSLDPPPNAGGFYTQVEEVTISASGGGVGGLTFSHWTVDGVQAEDNSPTYTVTMDGDRTVRAVFTRDFKVSG